MLWPTSVQLLFHVCLAGLAVGGLFFFPAPEDPSGTGERFELVVVDDDVTWTINNCCVRRHACLCLDNYALLALMMRLCLR